ncbi:hypothetical protein JOC28_001405 [Streptococcus loxodontisalivarius]|uniref:GNAT family N-acetyltransferase n=1 Tax=Streptococcus loxodontisalivarius TaxID=1349415 RepID=A0ABS2PST9_9STRE|nr:hypothetical protein [Streptococcus loxodontisalivarius]
MTEILRPIEFSDNAKVASLIRESLEKEGMARPGTAYFDPQLDKLADYYNSQERAAYFVIQEGEDIIASGGFAPVTDTIAEL